LQNKTQKVTDKINQVVMPDSCDYFLGVVIIVVLLKRLKHFLCFVLQKWLFRESLFLKEILLESLTFYENGVLDDNTHVRL
jgi:hypothetical protein